MPGPSLGKIALHFSRVAANNAAAGIRSALHTGNSTAASAGINATTAGGEDGAVPTSPSKHLPGLPSYHVALRNAFTLGLPDKAIEVFERIMKLTQDTIVSSSNDTRLPVHGSTITVMVRGFIQIGDPMTAVRWLSKLQELNSVSESPSEGDALATPRPHPSDASLIHLVRTLLDTLPPRGDWSKQKAEVDVIIEAITKVMKQIQPGQDTLEETHRRVLFGASETVRHHAKFQLLQAAREDTMQNQPWKDATVLLPQSPTAAPEQLQSSPNAIQSPPASEQSEIAPDATQAEPSVLTPPASPELKVQPIEAADDSAASEAPAFDTLSAAAGSPHQDQYYPGLPPVQLVDVDLGKEIEETIRPQRLKGQQLFVDVEGALAKIYDNVAIGTYPAPGSVGVVMMALGRQGDLARVNEMYAIASAGVAALNGDPEWQADAWHQVEDQSLCALAHAGEANAAIERRHRIIAAGRCPSADAYAALITTVKDTTDDALVAEELFDESQRLGVRPNVYLYTTVISKLSRARRISRALQLFEEMRAIGLRPTTVTYGAIMNACVRSGDRDGALRFFAEMEADPKFKARVPPYNTMIQHFTYTKDRTQALVFYEKMKARGVWPSSHTYKLLLDVHGTIEPVQPAEMEKVFEALRQDNGIRVQGAHWASLIQCYGSYLKNVDKAIEIFQASSQGSAPDPIAFEALLSVFFDANRPDLIRQYVASMQGSGLRPTAYVCNVLIKGLALEGSTGLVEARSIFEQMQDPPAGLAATGNHAARSHGAGALAQAETEASSPPPPSAAGAAASGYIGSYGMATAGIFSQVSKEPSTYESMIRAELSHGNVEVANWLLGRMEARAFPPALILRTHSLFDLPREQALTADLVASSTPRTGSGAGAEMPVDIGGAAEIASSGSSGAAVAAATV
ncbi:hypothetical protein A4X03_0g5802 [Tilletia caries]|uniref:Pentacotripeptide-repeat region of PRORP domain-containing protein n=1 Tax=Tilletia caries TaxID=13290 RepID=A0A177UHS9_9BASI|nr:hypothetical protein CF335_g5779 [Tilletia laevis]KAE8253821.1 hypothetical protein A4X03_0g5802 [Tilletia caries]CAD6940526.1 unnamed protein product [Tilletia caries]